MPVYQRALFKISGEAFGGESGKGFDPRAIGHIASEMVAVARAGVETAIVIGAGNFLRGTEAHTLGIETCVADYMGMTATILNALALQSAIENLRYPTRVLSALEADKVCEPYVRRRALRHLEKKHIVILAGGTGHSACTTDTAVALRAYELRCDILLKATQVDGIYTADPKKDPQATRYERVSYDEVIEKNLRVMDMNAFMICKDNAISLMVYACMTKGASLAAVNGEPVGTLVYV